MFLRAGLGVSFNKASIEASSRAFHDGRDLSSEASRTSWATVNPNFLLKLVVRSASIFDCVVKKPRRSRRPRNTAPARSSQTGVVRGSRQPWAGKPRREDRSLAFLLHRAVTRSGELDRKHIFRRSRLPPSHKSVLTASALTCHGAWGVSEFPLGRRGSEPGGERSRPRP